MTNANNLAESYFYQKCVCSNYTKDGYMNWQKDKPLSSPQPSNPPTSVCLNCQNPISTCLDCLKNATSEINGFDVGGFEKLTKEFCDTGEPNEFLYLNYTLNWLAAIDPMKGLDSGKTHVEQPLTGSITMVPYLEYFSLTDECANAVGSCGTRVDTVTVAPTVVESRVTEVVTGTAMVTANGVGVVKGNPFGRFVGVARRQKDGKEGSCLQWAAWYGAGPFVMIVLGCILAM
jgi:hypothetical protein